MSTVNRRDFIFKTVQVASQFAIANAAIYAIGTAHKSLDGSLVAGAKFTWGFCFVEGTLVTMKSGAYERIENVQVGDEVLTYNEHLKEFIHRPVTETFHHDEKESELYTIFYADQKITSNDQHRFYLADQDRYASAKEIYALTRADQAVYFLSEKNEKIKVSGIERWGQKVKLYNLHVSGCYDSENTIDEIFQKANHNYFANGVLVHNVKNCGGMSNCTDCTDAVLGCEGASDATCTFSNVIRCEFDSQPQRDLFDACIAADGGCDTVPL